LGLAWLPGVLFLISISSDLPGCVDLYPAFRSFSRHGGKHYRGFVKAVSWRLTSNVDTMIISFLVTGWINWALSSSGVALFTKVFLCYVHERAWNQIPFGRIREPKDKPTFEI
jgi:hypothetical protein